MPTTSPASTFAQIALALPEILLILCRELKTSRSDVSNFSRVCSLWTGPAQAELFHSISLPWRLSRAGPLLRALESNPSLCSLVRSVTLYGMEAKNLRAEQASLFDQVALRKEVGYKGTERGKAYADIWDEIHRIETMRVEERFLNHPDQAWLGDHVGTAVAFLVDFLVRLPNLDRLSIDQFSYLDQNFAVNAFWDDIVTIGGRLTDIWIQNTADLVTQHLLSAALQLTTLQLAGSSALLTPPASARLRHVIIEPGALGQPVDLSNYAESLETLVVHSTADELESYFPNRNLCWNRLSHLCYSNVAAYGESRPRTVDSTAFFRTAFPNLQYLEIVTSLFSTLRPLLPHLPPSATTVLAMIYHHDYNSSPTPEIISLLDEFPSVQHLHLFLPPSAITRTDRDTVVAHGRSRGIDLRIITPDLDPDVSFGLLNLRRMIDLSRGRS